MPIAAEVCRSGRCHRRPHGVGRVTRSSSDPGHGPPSEAGSDDIVIDDLADPRFSPEVAELLAAGRADGRATSSSTAEAVLAPGGGRDRPRRLRRRRLPRAARRAAAPRCATRPGSRAFGTLNLHTQLVQLLQNRLLRRRTCSPATPRSTTSRSRAPIIIAGLPRTGHDAPAQPARRRPALRSLPYWESLEPVPAPGEARPSEPGPAPGAHRRRRSTSSNAAMPLLQAHARDDRPTTCTRRSSSSPSTSRRCSSRPWRRCRRGATTTAPTTRRRTTEYLRTVLQVLQFLRGGRPLGAQVTAAPRAVPAAAPRCSPTPPSS